jgi:hypothetical protein
MYCLEAPVGNFIACVGLRSRDEYPAQYDCFVQPEGSVVAARKKSTSAKPAPVKARGRRRAKTKALAIADAVRREGTRSTSLMDSQLALFRAMLAWSPAGFLIKQQTAFLEGLAARPDTRRRPEPKRIRAR